MVIPVEQMSIARTTTKRLFEYVTLRANGGYHPARSYNITVRSCQGSSLFSSTVTLDSNSHGTGTDRNSLLYEVSVCTEFWAHHLQELLQVDR